MELTDEESLRPFKSLMDEYDESFYTRNIETFRSLHISDNGLVFFDNHANCDSITYKSHEAKVTNFFKSGKIENLIRESMRVFFTGDMACVTAILRYSVKATSWACALPMYLSVKKEYGKSVICIIRLIPMRAEYCMPQ